MIIYATSIGDVLAYIYEMLSKIVSVFEMIIHFIFSGISFLWDAVKWIYTFFAIMPSWISGIVVLSVGVAVVLLIVGR